MNPQNWKTIETFAFMLVNAVDVAYKKGSPPTNMSGDPILPIKR